MDIVVIALVDGCDTNDQGEVVRRHIVAGLESNGSVTVDFSGVDSATSSFVNSAFVVLLSRYRFDDIKRRVKVIGAHHQVASLIRRRMDFENGRLGAIDLSAA